MYLEPARPPSRDFNNLKYVARPEIETRKRYLPEHLDPKPIFNTKSARNLNPKAIDRQPKPRDTSEPLILSPKP